MIKKLLGLFTRKVETGNDFSDFFTSATREEKERVLREVVRKANEDQREVLRRYEKMYPAGAKVGAK